MQEVKRGAKSIPIFRLSPHLGQAHVGQFKIDERWRHQSRAFQSLGDAIGFSRKRPFAPVRGAPSDLNRSIRAVHIADGERCEVVGRSDAQCAVRRNQLRKSLPIKPARIR